MRTALFRAPLLVLDTETTGFPGQPWSRVIELAATLLDTDGTELVTFESFVLPDILDERAAGALAVNRITPEMLARAPSTEEVADRFGQWWREDCARAYCTAFNVGFDRAMLEKMALDLRWASCVMRRAIETMKANGHDFPGRKNTSQIKLGEAAAYYGVPVVGDAHRALTDARTAAGIAVALRLRQVKDEVATTAGEASP